MGLVLLLSWLLGVLKGAVFIYVLLSWARLPPEHPIVRALAAVCEPLLAPIRHVLPPMGGLDFSPLALLFILHFLQGFVVGLGS